MSCEIVYSYSLSQDILCCCNVECEHAARAHSRQPGRPAGDEQSHPAAAAAAATGPSDLFPQTAASTGAQSLPILLSCLTKAMQYCLLGTCSCNAPLHSLQAEQLQVQVLCPPVGLLHEC